MQRHTSIVLLLILILGFACPAGHAQYLTGSTEGIFVNPLPVDSAYTGVGTSHITLGEANSEFTHPSVLEFHLVSFDTFLTFPETDFPVGYLYFFNGAVKTTPPHPDSVDLALRLNFDEPYSDLSTTFNFPLQLIYTPNAGRSEREAADAVVLSNILPSISISLDGVSYTLQLREFRNVTNDGSWDETGFLTEDGKRFNVLEERWAQAEVWGRLVRNDPGAIYLLTTWQYCPSFYDLITIILKPENGSNPIYYYSYPDGPFGGVWLYDIPVGKYLLWVKGSKWLARAVPVEVEGGALTETEVTLLAGDANDDNSVNIFDLATLAEDFNSNPNDSNWNEGRSDFNCDGQVDIFDLAILAENFNTDGDPSP